MTTPEREVEHNLDRQQYFAQAKAKVPSWIANASKNLMIAASALEMRKSFGSSAYLCPFLTRDGNIKAKSAQTISLAPF